MQPTQILEAMLRKDSLIVNKGGGAGGLLTLAC